MRGAPPVRYPVVRPVRAAQVFGLLYGLALAVNGWWWLQGMAPWALAAAVGSLLLAVLIGRTQWHAQRLGALRWDGQAWWWSSAADAPGVEHPVSVAVRMDLEQGILVRMSGLPGGGRWCYLERRADAALWDALRRAVYCLAIEQPPIAPSVQP